MLKQLCRAAGGDAQQGAFAQTGGDKTRGGFGGRNDGQRLFVADDAIDSGVCAKGCFESLGQAVGLEHVFDHVQQLLAGNACIRREDDALHAMLVVEDERLRGFALRIVSGGFRAFGSFGSLRVLFGGCGLQLREGQRSGGGRLLDGQGDLTGFDSGLKRFGADSLALRGAQQRAQHVVGQLAARGDIQRRLIAVRLEGGYRGRGRGGVRFGAAGGGGAQQADQLILAEAAVGIKGDDDGTVGLFLGGKDGLSVKIRAGGLRKRGEKLIDRARDAADDVALQIVQDGIAKRIEHHDARAGAVDVGNVHAGKVVDLARHDAQRLLAARNGRAREGDALHPRAAAAHAQQAMIARIQGGIQIEGVFLCLRGGGDGHARAGCAGHEHGRRGEGIIGVGVLTALRAGDVERHMRHAGGRVVFPELDAACVGFGDRRTVSVGSAGFDLDAIELPIAGNSALAKRTGAHGQNQAQGEHAQNGFHLLTPFHAPEAIRAHFSRKNVTDYL